MADFADFELKGVDVAELAFGLLPEMSEAFGAALEPSRMVDSLGELASVVGKSKVLQENISDVQRVVGTNEDGLGIAADWVERSGIQKQLDRSLWTPAIQTPDDVNAVIVTGAVANWQSRAASLLERRIVDNKPATTVYMPTGNRIMNSVTEVVNPHVAQMYDVAGQLPTESEFANHVVRPVLENAGYTVHFLPQDTAKGSEIAARFVAEHPEVFTGTVAFARVANAGVQLAVQFRQAARKAGIAFDTDEKAPQAFVLTDTLAVARKAEELKKSLRYQNPLTAMRQIVITAQAIQQSLDADAN